MISNTTLKTIGRPALISHKEKLKEIYPVIKEFEIEIMITYNLFKTSAPIASVPSIFSASV